jgi:hypothetical protein
MKWFALTLLSLAILAAVAGGAIYATSTEVCRETGSRGGQVDQGTFFGEDQGERDVPSTLRRTCERRWVWE